MYIYEERERNKDLSKSFEEKFDLYSNFVDQGVISKEDTIEKINNKEEEKLRIMKELNDTLKRVEKFN